MPTIFFLIAFKIDAVIFFFSDANTQRKLLVRSYFSFGILLFYKIHFSFQFNTELMLLRMWKFTENIKWCYLRYDQSEQTMRTELFLLHIFRCAWKNAFLVLSTSLWDGSVMHLLFLSLSSFQLTRKLTVNCLASNINVNFCFGINYFNVWVLTIFQKPFSFKFLPQIVLMKNTSKNGTICKIAMKCLVICQIHGNLN